MKYFISIPDEEGETEKLDRLLIEGWGVGGFQMAVLLNGDESPHYPGRKYGTDLGGKGEGLAAKGLLPGGKKTLRWFRIRAGLSQSQVARELDVSQGRVHKWETLALHPNAMLEKVLALYQITPQEQKEELVLSQARRSGRPLGAEGGTGVRAPYGITKEGKVLW